MREIKFRAWDDIKKKMIQVESLIIPKGLNEAGQQELAVSDKFNSTYFSYLIAPPIMQYTGQKNKQGKEIYEGDILLNPPEPWCPKEIFKVYWDNSRLAWMGIGQYSEDELVAFSDDSEIIGNIYENPELLKESK
jgi:hypothetical protein